MRQARFVWLVAALTLAACAAPQPQGSAPEAPKSVGPKRIVAAIKGEPSVLFSNPGGVGVPGTDDVMHLVNAGLGRTDSAGRLQPRLAEAVPTTENGQWVVLPDGRMETTWSLKPVVLWHDGVAFTTEDLLFSARVSQEREVPAFRNIAYDSVESIEAPDGRTLVVRWKRPFIEADMLFSRAGQGSALPMPKHLLERPYAENRAAFAELSYWNQEFVGTGPFRLRDWVRGSHVVLTANEGYVLGRPKTDEIEVRFILDSNTLAANLLAGALDLTMNRTLSLDQAIEVRNQWQNGRVDISVGGWIVAYPQFVNPNPSVITDVRFRRAMLHGADRQQMAEALLGGLTTTAHVFLSPEEPEFPDIQGSIVQYGYDPSRATQLLEELGYAKGTDGAFRDGAGQRLAVEVRTSGEFDIHLSSMFALADQWQRLGVAVDPVVIPPQRSSDRAYVQTYPGFLLYNQPTTLDFLKRITSAQAPVPENDFVGRNHPRYRNPELDALTDKYFITIPRPERIQMLRQIVQHMTDQVVTLGLFYNTSPVMVSNRVQNVTRGKGGPTWNAHEWEVR